MLNIVSRLPWRYSIYSRAGNFSRWLETWAQRRQLFNVKGGWFYRRLDWMYGPNLKGFYLILQFAYYIVKGLKLGTQQLNQQLC